MDEEVGTCQITQEPLFVCGCAHVCVKHGSAMWSQFGLHGRGRFLLSHLDGKRKHLQRSRDAKAGSFTLFADPLAPSQKEPFAAGGMSQPHLVSSVPVSAKQSQFHPSLAPPWVHSQAIPDRAGSGSQASPSFGSPRLAFPQRFNHSFSPKRNVPQHLCLEPSCIQKPEFAHTC